MMKTFYAKVVWDTKFQQKKDLFSVGKTAPAEQYASEIVEVKAVSAALAKAGALTKFALSKNGKLAKNPWVDKVSQNRDELW